MTAFFPSTRTSYPVIGSASPATSGTPPLMPPPVAPPKGRSFHTTSPEILFFDEFSLVPPQASTKGLDAGKSTCDKPSSTPSDDPSSPAATQTVIPSADAFWNAWLNASSDCVVQLDSVPPQLIEMT